MKHCVLSVALLFGGVSAGGHKGGYRYAAYDDSSSSSGYGGYQTYAFDDSSSSSGFGGYDTFALPELEHPPKLGKFGHGLGKGFKHGGFKHKKHHKKHIPVVYEDVEVEQFVAHDGKFLKNEKNFVTHKKKVAITHHPVYHKTIVNHIVEHDQINKDVYHHIGEEEARHIDVIGHQKYGGKVHIDHGKKGHGAYDSIVATYGATVGAAPPSGKPIVTTPVDPVDPIDPIDPVIDDEDDGGVLDLDLGDPLEFGNGNGPQLFQGGPPGFGEL